MSRKIALTSLIFSLFFLIDLQSQDCHVGYIDVQINDHFMLSNRPNDLCHLELVSCDEPFVEEVRIKDLDFSDIFNSGPLDCTESNLFQYQHHDAEFLNGGIQVTTNSWDYLDMTFEFILSPGSIVQEVEWWVDIDRNGEQDSLIDHIAHDFYQIDSTAYVFGGLSTKGFCFGMTNVRVVISTGSIASSCLNSSDQFIFDFPILSTEVEHCNRVFNPYVCPQDSIFLSAPEAEASEGMIFQWFLDTLDFEIGVDTSTWDFAGTAQELFDSFGYDYPSGDTLTLHANVIDSLGNYCAVAEDMHTIFFDDSICSGNFSCPLWPTVDFQRYGESVQDSTSFCLFDFVRFFFQGPWDFGNHDASIQFNSLDNSALEYMYPLMWTSEEFLIPWKLELVMTNYGEQETPPPGFYSVFITTTNEHTGFMCAAEDSVIIELLAEDHQQCIGCQAGTIHLSDSIFCQGECIELEVTGTNAFGLDDFQLVIESSSGTYLDQIDLYDGLAMFTPPGGYVDLETSWIIPWDCWGSEIHPHEPLLEDLPPDTYTLTGIVLSEGTDSICAVSEPVTLSILDTTSVACSGVGLQESEELNWTIYPNPVNDRLYIEFENMTNDKVNYSVLDANGRRISVVYSDGLDVSGLSEGMYVLEVSSGQAIHRKRFLVL